MHSDFSGRERKVTVLLVALLALCMAAAAWVIAAPRYEEAEGSARGNPLGLVLIGIDNDKVAASYHVDEFGVYVLAVDEESQAYDAGVRSGDRLISVNGTQIQTISQYEAAQQQFSQAMPVQVDFCAPSQERCYTTNLLWTGE